MEIDTHKFYKIGSWCFGISAVAGLIGFVMTYQFYSNVFDIISRIANLVFTFALFGFFLWMLRQLPPKMDTLATDQDMIAMIKETTKEVEHGIKKPRSRKSTTADTTNNREPVNLVKA